LLDEFHRYLRKQGYVAIGGQVIVPALSPPKQRNDEENEAIKAPLERERADVSTTQKVFPRRQSLGVMTRVIRF
jgi:hypothetical protein